MSKTMEELQKELAGLQAQRETKDKLIKDAAKDIAALGYRQNQLVAELETLKREQEALAKQNGEDLETKFEMVKKDALERIQKHLAAAKAEFDKAVKISEETAVPFETSIVDLAIYKHDGHISKSSDVYVPTTCVKTWGDLMEDDLSEFISGEYNVYPGWYYDGDYESGFTVAWAPSSMRC